MSNAKIEIRRARKAEALAHRMGITEEYAAEVLARHHWVMDAAIKELQEMEASWAENEAALAEKDIAREKAVERQFAQWLAFPGDR